MLGVCPDSSSGSLVFLSWVGIGLAGGPFPVAETPARVRRVWSLGRQATAVLPVLLCDPEGAVQPLLGHVVRLQLMPVLRYLGRHENTNTLGQDCA